jgi:cytochrome c553
MFYPLSRALCSTILALGLSLLFPSAARAADKEIDVEDLKPGLLATFRDNAKPPHETSRLEPTIALHLKAGEGPHPRLAADGGTYVWKGYVNLLRAGDYRFQVRLRGKLTIRIGLREVFAAEVRDAEPALKQGADVKLDAGVHPIVAEFTRLPGPARIELRWQATHFTQEPLPYQMLGHLPAELPARFAEDARSERGRQLAEEAACTRCHRADDGDRLAAGLVARQAPVLSKVGQRLFPGWIDAWLQDPHKLRPGAIMPELFAADEAAERYAVVRYLASLGGPVKTVAPPKDLAASSNRGRKLFSSIGCIVCHGSADENDPPRAGADSSKIYPLIGLGSKTTPERLAEYLQNPLAIDRSGRMPHMILQTNEALDLAHFLCRSTVKGLSPDLPKEPDKDALLKAFQRVEDRADERKAFEKLKPAEQWLDLGQRLVMARGCNNCHTIAPDGKPFANILAHKDLNDLKKMEKPSNGCLAADAGKRGAAPWFHFTAKDRDALRAFLKKGLDGAGSPAPTYAARATIERFNCLACHRRDGAGGVSPETTEELRRYEKAENAEAVTPPTLTGVGHKLRTSWLRQLLLQAGRARPWMGLRMPQFGEANVGNLVEGLSLLDGVDPDDTLYKVPLTAAKIETGRRLVGKTMFGCASCHDVAGNISGGTRGPDLVTTNRRVRYDWYRRWLEQSQRMAPGTKMPSYFLNGKSPLDVLGGDPDAQAEAIWAYMSLGDAAPLPDGLLPPKGLTLTVGERPILLRTFMPEAGSRAMALGFPNGVSTAFDAATCRLSYAWSGNFLDAAPVWDGRGGNPAKVLGVRFWSAPPGCPLGVTPSNESPDFAARAKDPAYGANPGEGKVHDGPALLQFAGYSLDREGIPTFRYRLKLDQERNAEVAERAEPLRSTAGVGVNRKFTVSVPDGQTTWLNAGSASREPRLLDAKGATLTLDLKDGRAEFAAAGKALVLPQDGEKVLVLTSAGLPDGAEWRVQRQGGGWQVLLRVPPAGAAAKVKLDLHVWAPYRDEAGLIKEVIAAK